MSTKLTYHHAEESLDDPNKILAEKLEKKNFQNYQNGATKLSINALIESKVATVP